MKLNIPITLALLSISLNAGSQIVISGTNGKLEDKVNSAISLVEETDSSMYNILLDNCNKIDFWDSDSIMSFSNGAILIPVKELEQGSIEDLSAILIKESMRLFFINSMVDMEDNLEDVICYTYELDYRRKLEKYKYLGNKKP
jgi:hypothetical protein